MQKKHHGFTLIEIMITLAIIGAAVAVVLVYQNRAESGAKVSQTVTAMTNMTSKIKGFYASAGTYTGLDAKQINSMGLVTQPLTAIVNAGATTMYDPWGNVMGVAGNAANATPTFVITIGGNVNKLTAEECVSLATNLANGADVVNVGDSTVITTNNGLVGGGSAYKAGNAVVMANLTTGCGANNPTIGLQYH